MKSLALALLASCLTACQSYSLEKLPAFDASVKLKAESGVHCFYGESMDVSKLPQMVPFTAVSTSYSNKSYEDTWAKELGRYAAKNFDPDLILLYEGGSYYAGSVGSATAFPTSYGAFAVGFSTPTYANALVGVCYRLAPVNLGFRWDETGMVISADEAARASGLLEGDRIVSIADAPVTLGKAWARSPHYPKLLELQPNTDARVVWIRPGTGRMEGQVKLAENPPTYVDLPGALDLTVPKPAPGAYP